LLKKLSHWKTKLQNNCVVFSMQ